MIAIGIVGPGLVGIDEPGTRSQTQLSPTDPGETVFNGSHGQLTSSDVAIAIHAQVNHVREAAGKPALSWNATLATVARSHSGDMATRGYVAHESPDGATLLDRYDPVAINCASYGETIAHTYADTRVTSPNGSGSVTYHTADELAIGIVAEWLDSPPHRETILTPEQSWGHRRRGSLSHRDRSGVCHPQFLCGMNSPTLIIPGCIH
ncbi:MAG: CAP domain-containing protein [Natrialbaceae archaeon]|nr:CAP domain-containing protein [Natrialbaceae archaeon]